MNKKSYNPKEIIKYYRTFHPEKQFTLEDVYEWAMQKGFDLSAEFDPKTQALHKLKRALKNSCTIDPQGRKIPVFVNVGDESKDEAVWLELELTPQPIMQKVIDKLKNKGVQNLIQAQTIADSYNENINIGVPVQLELGLIEDEVMEGALMRKRPDSDEELAA